MKKERLVAAPHTFMLSVLLMISIPAAYAIMLISHQESIGAFLRVPGALQVTLLVAVIYLALLVTLFCTRYQWAAVAEICEDRIVFWALFTHRTFYYGDMHHICIDYGLLDGRKQFWMYFSKTPIPAMYYHRINRMKPSRSFMRVQYCKKTYERLVATLLFKEPSFGTWVHTWGCNMPMALCWQMLYCGPLSRAIFRLLFRRGEKKAA